MSKIITDEYILEMLKQHNYLSGMEYEWLADRLEALTAENAKLREACTAVVEAHKNCREGVFLPPTLPRFVTLAREALREKE